MRNIKQKAGRENGRFPALLKEIFSSSPYSADPRREMMFNHIRTGRQSTLERLLPILPYLNQPIDKITVLDAGCGSGMATAALTDVGFRQIIGFDLGREAIGLPLAPTRTYHPDATVSFIQANGFKIPIATNSINFCWSSFVVEHIATPFPFFKEIFRVLAPGGIVYLSTNNRLWPIEPHSGTYFSSWLPSHWAERVVRWQNKWPDWETWDVYPPTYWQFRKWAKDAGYNVLADTFDLVGPQQKEKLNKIPLASHLGFLLPNLYLLLQKPVA